MSECVFCDIAAGTGKARFVREWEGTFAIEPLDPVVEGHVLVIPNQHVVDFMEDPHVTGLTVRRAAELGRSLGLEAANVVSNAGKAGWQSMFHFHVHLLPRKRGDGLVLESPRWRSAWSAVAE